MDIRSMDYRFIEGRRGLGLFVGASRRPLVMLVRDVRYPTMWRLKLRGGELSDMVDLPRAKDAALDFGDRYLRRTAGGSGAGGPPMRLNGSPVPGQPPEAKLVHGGPAASSPGD